MAPAVAFILAEGGFGSGFVINTNGWLISNHHVAKAGTLREDLSREVTVMRNVRVIQATCPILHGDSGGPLLDISSGRAVGITSYANPESGGVARFFIHASEIRDFVTDKDPPASPLQALPSFWEASAN